MTQSFAMLDLADLRGILREIATPDPIVDMRSLPSELRRKAYAAARTGALPAKKLGKRWYAKQSAIDAWLFGDEKSQGVEDDAAVVARWAP